MTLAQTTQPHLATRCGVLVALSNASSVKVNIMVMTLAGCKC